MPFKGKRSRTGKPYQGGQNQSKFKKRKSQHRKAASNKQPKYGKPETVKEEDSPFAALAALKKQMPGDKS